MSDPKNDARYLLLAKLMNSLDDEIALVDRSGTILRTNAAWDQFSEANDGDLRATGPGANYLNACEHAARQGVEGAGQLAMGLRQLCQGDRLFVEQEYPCHSPRELRWFTVQARPFDLDGRPGAVIIHRNATIRTQLASELREMQMRYSELQRREGLSEWTAYLAHEILNPLNAANLRASLLDRLLGEKGSALAKERESCHAITAQLYRITTFVQEVRRSVLPDRQDEPLSEIPVGALLEDLRVLFEHRAGFTGLALKTEPVDAALHVTGHPMQLRHVLMSALLHAFEVARQDLQLRAVSAGDWVEMRITGLYGRPVEAAEPSNADEHLDLTIASRLAAIEQCELQIDESNGRFAISLLVPRLYPPDLYAGNVA